MSPSGRYELEVVSWDAPNGWEYSQGVVRRVRDRREIADVRRNYGMFPFAWCEDHPSRHDYLIAGEDYQGQTVLELDTAARVDHLPDTAERGTAFCWAKHYVSPDKTVLVVDGCFWACPYELVAFDFTSPLRLPYEKLHRWAGDLRHVDGFDESGTLTWTFDRTVRLSEGKVADDLTEDEDAALVDADGRYRPDALGTVTWRARWRLGDPFDATTIEMVRLPR